MKPIEVTSTLFLVPLDQPIEGFSHFISAWLYKGEKTILVDVGPSGTVPELLRMLDLLDVRHIDAILLTHIHIDHAGGIGDVVKRFPGTPVVCHRTAMPHLEDPSRLWEGSLKVLGTTARAYGEIRAVPGDLLVDADQFNDHGIQSIQTPGHAPHHVSYFLASYLFAGEAGGVFVDLSADRAYLRPATPPRFFLETSVKSIDALLKVPHRVLCYGHFGATTKTPFMLEAHKEQLFRWAEIIREEIGRGQAPDISDRCLEKLIAGDERLKDFHRLDSATQKRERFFLLNSIKGFLQYMETGEP
jgi:glyoxylase-like metal-dependent hydrolase (beta-lactamase superfamily II)